MCYDDQARPPQPPGESGKAHGAQIVLRASDGNEFYAYAASPDDPTELGVLIYPDVRGLHQFYRDLALRFAEMGIAAIAIDYFGRTAGLTGREEGFEYTPHVQELRIPTITLDAQAALAHLRAQLGTDAPIFLVGFCIGGSLTLVTGANPELGVTGLIPFYAGMTRDFAGVGTVLDFAPRIKVPVLGFFGGADQGIPENAVQELDKRLDDAGMEHRLIVYPGAPHSFFDRKAAEYAEASRDAWQHALDFIRTRGKIGQTA